VSWSRRFEESIELPDGRKLKTLAEAIAWLAKEIPKSEHKMARVQTAAHLVTRAAEHGGPMERGSNQHSPIGETSQALEPHRTVPVM